MPFFLSQLLICKVKSFLHFKCGFIFVWKLQMSNIPFVKQHLRPFKVLVRLQSTKNKPSNTFAFDCFCFFTLHVGS